ncbi:DUF354 domain-containing protein [Rhodohalobacter sp. SW132]|uniref:DUF354 domain-containing protein n=1 Tax=Rhodohalobacter sp. SW132 TaxID=2293433 RepID=UPI000E26683C|nr:DUF354 domain-containing protein [Rhodohalobacter sp. SW132]REL33820.1 DUF354 domain-containing protein [Rhodohalobacter sp. SW132]
MKVLFELHHPKHYYQVKHIYHKFDDFLFVIKAKDILEELLISEGVEYVKIGGVKAGIVNKLTNSVGLMAAFAKVIRAFKPDVVFSKASPYSAFLSPLFSYKTIITPDSEVVALTNKFVSRLSDLIITQHCFELDFGKKHVKLDTFFESCYLHPDYFTPNPEILSKHGINPDQKLILLRFIGWGANHDIGKSGLPDQEKIELVKKLELYGRVIISSEKKLPVELEGNKFSASPNVMHQLMHHASLYMGDSQSMATEAALLGTPAIRCNSFVGPDDMSNFVFLENQLNLLHNFSSIDMAVDKAFELLEDDESKSEWNERKVSYFKSIQDPNVQLLNYINQL